MNYCLLLFILYRLFSNAESSECAVDCAYAPQEAACGYEVRSMHYRLFPSSCALEARAKCEKTAIVDVALKFCVKQDHPSARRDYDDGSCPVFCPTHYSPVCGQSVYRSFMYRTFINRCYMDIVNCRSNNELEVYEEVSLQYCPRHAMKNIFKQKLVVSGKYDTYRDLYRK